MRTAWRSELSAGGRRQPAARVVFACLLAFGLLAGTNAHALKPAQVAIASAHPLATDAGFAVIRAGGNVFDAAVAVSAALAVVEPAGSGLGGGGYWLLHRAEDGFETVIDGREQAPAAASETLFVDADGRVAANLSVDTALAAAIPGLPAALAHLSERYGRLPLARSLAPAVGYARNGFAIGPRHVRFLQSRLEVLRKNQEAAAVFLNHGRLPAPFSLLKQPDLADTLSELAERGHQGFYRGRTAERLVRGVRAAGGIWSLQDLASYRIAERPPVKGRYRDITVTSAPPSSSGGTVLIEALNILEGYDRPNISEAVRDHLIIEAWRRAYHDRALYLGDPDFVAMPLSRLLDKRYAAGLRASISPDRALPSGFLAPPAEAVEQGPQTTHFSIMDSEGNRVAATLSINFPFGAGIVASGTGVVLNNEMDDFSSAPGVKNGYGLIGGKANSIAPGKRMLSSMTPAFLESPGRVAVLGTPGGSRIISMVMLSALQFADGADARALVDLPRFHHQYVPDVVEYEPGALAAETLFALALKGHRLQSTGQPYGNMQAVVWSKAERRLEAASDRRGEGRAAVGAR